MKFREILDALDKTHFYQAILSIFLVVSYVLSGLAGVNPEVLSTLKDFTFVVLGFWFRGVVVGINGNSNANSANPIVTNQKAIEVK